MKYKPQYIFFLIGLNDVCRDDLRDYDRTLPMPGDIYMPNLLQKLQYSKLFSYIINLRINYSRAQLAKMKGLQHSSVDFANSSTSNFDSLLLTRTIGKHRSDYIPAYQSRIKKLIKKCRENNIQPVFITQPAVSGNAVDSSTGVNLSEIAVGDSLNGGMFWALLQAYNHALTEVCDREGCACVELGNLLPKNTLYYYDYFHFTNEGAAKAADIIFNEAEREKILSY